VTLRTADPVFLELAGLPATGKTTSALLLKQRLTELGLSCSVLPERDENSSLRTLRGHWYYNAWRLCRLVAQVLEAQCGQPLDVVIVDRGVVDALCWFAWLRRRGELPDQLAKVLESFLVDPPWIRGRQLVCVMRVAYETAVARRGGRTGFVVNERTYAEVELAYSDTLRNPPPSWSQKLIRYLDTDHLSHEAVLRTLLDWLGEISPVVRSSSIE